MPSKSSRELQWGRSFEAAETNQQWQYRLYLSELQWGRSFEAAETNGSNCRRFLSFDCFNGAAALRLRKPMDGETGRRCRVGFNGAAALRLRKPERNRPTLSDEAGASMGPQL